MKDTENIKGLRSDYGLDLPFTVPQGYFDSLPQRVQEYCVTHSRQQNKGTIPLWHIIKTQISLAGGFVALAVFAFSGYYFLQSKPNAENMVSNNHYFEIIQTDVCCFDNENHINQPELGDTVRTKQKDEVIHYILKQNIDYTTLVE